MFGIFKRASAEPPANFTLGQQRDRAATELVGLCRGVLADGIVSTPEALFIKDWIERNAHLAT
jgi:hypothetical protein